MLVPVCSAVQSIANQYEALVKWTSCVCNWNVFSKVVIVSYEHSICFGNILILVGMKSSTQEVELHIQMQHPSHPSVRDVTDLRIPTNRTHWICSKAVVTLAMLSWMRTVRGLPGGLLFVADAVALNCWTHRVIDFLGGTLSFRPISKCCRNKFCVRTTLSPLLKNVSITNTQCSFDQHFIPTGNALNCTTHWY